MRLLAAFVVCTLLTGCAVGPDYQKPEIVALPAKWSGNEAGRDSAAVGNLMWWRSLQDATLNKLVKVALENNTDMKLAVARVAEARAQRQGAQAAKLPQVDGTVATRRGSINVGTTDRVGSQSEMNFDASWELDIFGGQRRAAEAAQATLESREAALRNVRVSLLAEMVRAYFEVRRLEQQIQLTRQNLKGQRETLKIVNEQMQEGVASQLDVSRIEAQSYSTEATIPELQAQLVQARNTVAVLVGVTPDRIARLLPYEKMPTVGGKVVVQAPATVIAARPDVQVAERDLAAATANQGVAISNWFPKVSLLGLFGLQHNGPLGKTDVWNAGGTVRLPLFDFGRVRSQVRVADARQQQALATYEQTVLTAVADVENSLTAYVKARQRLELLGKAAEASRTAERLARLHFQEGLNSLLDVLVAQRERLDAETTYATAQAQLGQRYAFLYKALGGGAVVTKTAVLR